MSSACDNQGRKTFFFLFTDYRRYHWHVVQTLHISNWLVSGLYLTIFRYKAHASSYALLSLLIVVVRKHRVFLYRARSRYSITKHLSDMVKRYKNYNTCDTPQKFHFSVESESSKVQTTKVNIFYWLLHSNIIYLVLIKGNRLYMTHRCSLYPLLSKYIYRFKIL